jgi:hypothetical protein
MGIQDWSDDTILVELLQEPDMKDELNILETGCHHLN